jgi:hypothetical protein
MFQMTLRENHGVKSKILEDLKKCGVFDSYLALPTSRAGAAARARHFYDNLRTIKSRARCGFFSHFTIVSINFDGMIQWKVPEPGSHMQQL